MIRSARPAALLVACFLAACGDGDDLPSRDEYDAALSTPADSVRRARGAAAAGDTAAPARGAVADGGPARDAAADGDGTDGAAARPGGRDTAWTAGIREGGTEGMPTATQIATRFGRHADYDRVVFEFRERVPRYHIEYVDRPIHACGSGDVVPVAGDGWLEVRFTDARAHDDEGRGTIDARRHEPRLPVLLEARLTCDFEAMVTWVLGVGSPNRYRLLELRQPPRLVIDIRH